MISCNGYFVIRAGLFVSGKSAIEENTAGWHIIVGHTLSIRRIQVDSIAPPTLVSKRMIVSETALTNQGTNTQDS